MITIDPNLRGCGVAEWYRGQLVFAIYVKNPEPGRGYSAHTALGRAVRGALDVPEALVTELEAPVVIEHPRVYPGMPQVDLNDLLDVVAVGATVAASFRCEVQTVFPSEWKGTMKKAAMLDRIWSKLSADEKLVVQKTNKSDSADILDAIGIGLWKLGRLSTKVYPGAVP
jgi:hypothetical protein